VFCYKVELRKDDLAIKSGQSRSAVWIHKKNTNLYIELPVSCRRIRVVIISMPNCSIYGGGEFWNMWWNDAVLAAPPGNCFWCIQNKVAREGRLQLFGK
jgi:hypothetical protein